MVTVRQATTSNREAADESAPTGAVVINDVTWEMYENILAAFGERRLRHTYVNGMLEIMSPLHAHEMRKHFIGRLIEMMAWHTGVPIKGSASTTLRKKLKKRGLEPDESYYIANESLVRGRDEIDLQRDPPPDLVVEVDVTHKSLDRLEAYSKLGVPEIWRHDGKALHFLKLDSKGAYVPSKHSLAFPRLAPNDIQRYLEMLPTRDENSILDDFIARLGAKSRPKK